MRPILTAMYPLAVMGTKCNINTSCNQTASMYTYGPLEAHATPSIYAAECNGTWQTHHYYCRPCGGNETIRQMRCPAGPHTGGCTVLPV